MDNFEVYKILTDVRSDIEVMRKAKVFTCHSDHDKDVIKAYDYCLAIVDKKIDSIMKGDK